MRKKRLIVILATIEIVALAAMIWVVFK